MAIEVGQNTLRCKRKAILIAVTIDYQLNYHDGLFQSLAQDGWEVHVLCEDGPNLHRLASAGVETHILNMGRRPSPLRDLKSLFSFLVILRKVRPNILFVGTPKASLIGLIAGRIARIQHRLYFVHGLKLEGLQGWRRRTLARLEETMCALATQIIPVSQSVATSLMTHARASLDKIHVIQSGSCNGVDLQVFDYRSAASSDTKISYGLNPHIPTVGFVGRLTRDKGLPELATALELLHRQGFRFELFVVGAMDDVTGIEGLRMLERAGNRVVTTGFVPMTSELYACMDLLVLPSLREGMSNVVLEAFACGTPVVGTCVTGIVDLVRTDETGYLVPAQDSRRLAEAIGSAIENLGQHHMLTTAARSLVEAKFERVYVVQSQLDYLNKVVCSER